MFYYDYYSNRDSRQPIISIIIGDGLTRLIISSNGMMAGIGDDYHHHLFSSAAVSRAVLDSMNAVYKFHPNIFGNKLTIEFTTGDPLDHQGIFLSNAVSMMSEYVESIRAKEPNILIRSNLRNFAIRSKFMRTEIINISRSHETVVRIPFYSIEGKDDLIDKFVTIGSINNVSIEFEWKCIVGYNDSLANLQDIITMVNDLSLTDCKFVLIKKEENRQKEFIDFLYKYMNDHLRNSEIIKNETPIYMG